MVWEWYLYAEIQSFNIFGRMIVYLAKRILQVFIILFFAGAIWSQNPRTDSLLKAINTASSDSLQQDARLLYIQELRYNYEKASKYVFDGIYQAKTAHDFYFLTEFYSAAGVMYSYIGNNDSALTCFHNSLNYAVYRKDQRGIADASLGVSNIYRTIGDYKNAARFALDAEKASLREKDTSGLARIYNSLGLIFKQQKDYDKALSYYEKCLDQVLMLDDDAMESGVYSNIGSAYQEKKQYDSALVYHRYALDIRQKTQDPMGLGITYGNFGLIFLEENNYDSAFYYINLALSHFESVHFMSGVQQCYFSLGQIWQRKGNYQNAVVAYKRAEGYARDGNFLPDLLRITKGLATSYRVLKKYKEASDYFSEYVSLRDSLEMEEQTQEVQRLELEFEYRQKQLADSLKVIEKEKLALLETEKQKQINEQQVAKFRIYTLAGIAVLALILSVVFVLYRSNKKQREFNAIIADQKAEVEEKNKEITDSINYAKRIQEAILPPTALITKYLPQSFVFYQPKDIVAGDFYWFHYSENQILIAAADCTGHGVPGAMVSVVCSNALNRTVKELGIKKPGKILDTVRLMVIETFEKSENEVKDGMDIALISLQKDSSGSKWLMQFAGANNPLWIVKKGLSEMDEVKGDSQPIGKFADLKAFTNHEQTLSSGDMLYVFTDGYQDQFGGPRGKKFKAANLKKLLVDIAGEPLSEQKKKLENQFGSWRGSLEQLDDVCVIGIRL